MFSICDSHIHVGQFFDVYTSPISLIELLKRLQVTKYAVSSTTICEENYSKVLHEFDILLNNDYKRVHPILWITPNMIYKDTNLNIFLDSGIKWKCIKIHPDLHPNLWNVNNGYMEAVLEIAKDLDLPLLIHTGGNKYSASMVWESFIKENPKQNFILSHCRPVEQAKILLRKYDNAYGDLAFVSNNEMRELFDEGLYSKILWGSDIPITKYYEKKWNYSFSYFEELNNLKGQLSEENFKIITNKNFNKLFN